MKYLTFALLVILMVPLACNDDDYNCGKNTPRYTDITGLDGQNLRLQGDNYRDVTPLADEERVTFDQYALRVVPTVEYTDQQANATGRWFGAAYACSPLPPQPIETIADIAVFSNAAYQQANSNKVIAAGERLNNIIKIYDYYSGRIVGLADFLIDEDLAAFEDGFLLQLTATPAQETRQQLTVRYTLNNGEEYEYTASPVLLAP